MNKLFRKLYCDVCDTYYKRVSARIHLDSLHHIYNEYNPSILLIKSDAVIKDPMKMK